VKKKNYIEYDPKIVLMLHYKKFVMIGQKG